MSGSSVHLLMTGAGAPGGPGILRCLQMDKRLTITVSDADEAAAGRWLHSSFITLPRGDAPDYTERLLEAARERGIQAVLPLTTAELLPLAEAAPRLAREGITVLTASAELLRISNDKGSTYTYLSEKGIALPRFRLVSNITGFSSAVEELGYPNRTLCFKPRVGNGSRGFRVLSEQGPGTSELFGNKPGAFSLSRKEAQGILSSGPFPELLLADYVEGEEYSVDCLYQAGREPLIIPRLREKMTGGITVKGTFVRHEAVIAYCRAILNVLPLAGISGIQVRVDKERGPLLLEINPRVQGTVAAGLGAGVNLPLLMVASALGWPTEGENREVAWGTRFTRYWSEVFY